ncbi:hypothetical protein BsWGS_06101 [Bradybaena similaris]
MKVTFLVVLLGILGLQVFAQTPDYCLLKPDTGPCDAIFYNFYYNADTSKCEAFIYGGCSGNKNNFHSMQECMDACVSD